jgi:hypothetical protein
MTNYHLTRISGNAKTGRIPVSTSSASTCPDSCPLKQGGCYAKGGKLSIHWQAVTSGARGVDFDQFADQIKKLPRGQLWRHNQAGDLVGENDKIDAPQLQRLVESNKGKRGFTYTHKPLNVENQKLIKHANDNGFTINLSANNPSGVDALMALKIAPVVTVLPENAPKISYSKQGHKIVVCPAQSNDKTTCETCGLCQLVDRPYIIGFLAHGASKKKALINTGN